MAKKNILIPLTKSESSQQILPQIEKFIPAQESRLVLFYVMKPPRGTGFAAPDYRSDYVLESAGEPLGPEPHPVYSSQREDSLQADVEVALLPVTNDLKQQGYEVSVQVCFGEDIVDEIVRTVKREKIDLVVMSTRARVGMLRFFFSDIADKVIQQVDIPVLLIHPKG
jgi:nucleotide-binding universal stress UspA family protein